MTHLYYRLPFQNPRKKFWPVDRSHVKLKHEINNYIYINYNLQLSAAIQLALSFVAFVVSDILRVSADCCK